MRPTEFDDDGITVHLWPAEHWEGRRVALDAWWRREAAIWGIDPDMPYDGPRWPWLVAP